MKWLGWREALIGALVCMSVLQQVELLANALQPVEREGLYVFGAVLKELKRQGKDPGELDWQSFFEVLQPAEIKCVQRFGTPTNERLISIECKQRPVIGFLTLARPGVEVRIVDRKTTSIYYGYPK